MAGTSPPLGSTDAASLLMGIQVGVSKSRCLPPGLHVPASVTAVLIANGWTPPPDVHQVHRSSQDPTAGPFLLPERINVRTLTREEADAELRRRTAKYYEETIPDGDLTVDNEEPRFSRFVRKLSYKLDADFDKDYVLDIITGWDDVARLKNDAADIDLTCAINKALDNTGAFGIAWIVR